NGFDPGVPTAWLVEGLLRYVPADAQDRLLTAIAALSAPGSRVAINTTPRDLTSKMQEQEDARDRMLASLGIDLDVDALWYPADGRTDPVGWFTEQGWTVVCVDPVAVLTGRDRRVPSEVAEEMRSHMLMTATRPGGDNTL
ncbi:SAM-dependent methyltransferase, partial [Nocardia colli]